MIGAEIEIEVVSVDAATDLVPGLANVRVATAVTEEAAAALRPEAEAEAEAVEIASVAVDTTRAIDQIRRNGHDPNAAENLMTLQHLIKTLKSMQLRFVPRDLRCPRSSLD